MDSNDLCGICDTTLAGEKTVEITERRRKSLENASLQRGDRILLKLRGRTNNVHEMCYNNYVNHKLIEYYVAKQASLNKEEVPSTSQQSTLFNFDKTCFYCLEDASDEFILKESKKPKNKRIAVLTLTCPKLLRELLDKEINRNTEDSRLTTLLKSVDLSRNTPRYHRKCQQQYLINYKLKPLPVKSEAIVEYVIDYLKIHKDECQFSLNEILQSYKGDLLDIRYICTKLQESFGHEIIITHVRGKDTIISYKDSVFNLAGDNWYSLREKNEIDERRRIVKAAAEIIREDIRSQVYKTDKYPIPHDFFCQAEDDIPESLKIMLDVIIMTNKKKDTHQWKLRSTSIAHCLITAARPRSYLSSIQMALALILHSKTGSKDVVRLLNAFGFCSSYEECANFQNSVAAHSKQTDFSHCYSQFVFDNADHTVNTLDGFNTFHAMGGIQCVTPAAFVTAETEIPRLTKNMPGIGNFRATPLIPFEKQANTGLCNVNFQDIYNKNAISFDFKISTTDLLWIFSKKIFPNETPGWNGFLDEIYSDAKAERSRVIFLPFVNALPSNYDTIFTVLNVAWSKAKAAGQNKVFVTFDQPLYLKAKEIVASLPETSELRNVIVRLGGFHLLISYLGSVGQIMENSGLKELLCEAFAPNTINRMLDGHQYARALRAHQLAHLALSKIIVDKIVYSNSEINYIKNLSDNITSENLEEISTQDTFECIRKKFDQCLEQLKANGPTAQLWVLYYEMITLAKEFVDAERTGNWSKHIEIIQKMLPFFHSSRHFLYAKCAHLYVQEMLDLKHTLSEVEYEKFVTKGFFTVRRSDKFRSGIWSDMTIEQTLMRTMHSAGGVTRGRGMTDNILTKWITCMPTLLDVYESLIDYSKVSINTNSDQHKDATGARISRDDKDCAKFYDWFLAHDPFLVNKNIINISSGFIGDEDVNCYRALEVGRASVQNIIDKNIKSIKFKKSMGVTTMKNINLPKKNENAKEIDPTSLFQRICVLKKNDTDLKDCFSCEMAPYPVTLFDDKGMRKNVKSKFYEFFDPCNDVPKFDNTIYVIDGGFLLHRVVWNVGTTYGEICKQYVAYLQKYYNTNCIVIFDNYPDNNVDKSTKTAERIRRMVKCSSAEIDIKTDMVAINQLKFLSNDKNKKRLIMMLRENLQQTNILDKQADEDADALIIHTAINYCASYQTVAVVGEDVDLLVLLCQFGQKKDNLYFIKQNKSGVDNVIYKSDSFKHKEVSEYITFLHAFSGADTTSAFFNIGKSKFVKTLLKNDTLQKELECFNADTAQFTTLGEVGAKFVMAVYGAKKGDTNLDELRYKLFTKSSVRKFSSLSILPPTKAATVQHCLRVYFQLQQWKQNNTLNPTEYGWRNTKMGLLPLMTTANILPQKYIEQISCSCSKGCNTKNCSCKKLGIFCSVLCKNCEGKNCSNIEEIDILQYEDEEDVEGNDIFTEHNVLVDNMEAENIVIQDEDEDDDCTACIEDDNDDENHEIICNAAKKMRCE